MRPTLLEADDTVSFQAPPPCHHLQGCARQSNSRGFEANAAAVLIVLLCGLICALALITAIRCFLRRAADHYPSDEEEARGEATKPTALVEKWKSMAPALVFTAEMKPKLAGAEAECAICLTEFTEGEEIRVLAICKHGFHVQCIQTWLILHSSCPTCRCCYLTPSAAAATPEIGLGLPEFSPIAAVVAVS